MKWTFKAAWLSLALFFLISATDTSNAFAIDKRLKLMFKTAGYGAAAGFVIGAGTMALGMGGVKNMLMGASSGMYAGILLAAYIVGTPPEREDGPRNPYPSRRPIGPHDWENEDEDGIEDHLPPEQRSDAGVQPALALVPEPSSTLEAKAVHEVGVWMPLVSLNF